MKKLEGKPFTLLGINSDGSRSALKDILEKEKITWPNIQDESPGTGPIAKRWNVHGWPTIYILDHTGKIRFKDLRDEKMEEAVMKLIDEISKPGDPK
ncbi:MAG: TlpA family protein disulfide reductase [Planctomycetes bacterium]|nr:TlpA family protein disulfide reductase [Planctomycetota bacterium]